MLSKLTKRYLYLAGNLTWLGGGVPCRLTNDRHKNSFIVQPKSKNRFRLFYEQANKTINLLYIVFIVWRLLKLKSENASLAAILRTSYFLSCYTISVVNDFQSKLKGDVTPYFIVNYINFFEDIQTKFTSFRLKKRKKQTPVLKCNVFLTILFIVGSLIFLQNYILLRKRPKTLHFLTSLINSEMKHAKLLRVPLSLLQCWVWYNLFTSIYFYIFPLYVYTYASICLLKELT